MDGICISTPQITDTTHDNVDAHPDDARDECQIIQVATEAKMPVEKEETHYNTNHNRRGKAIIFNHENFTDKYKYGPRHGTNVDRDKLTKLFKGLGFDVSVHNDLTHDELFGVIKKAAAHDYSDCDCLVIVVLSHGTKEGICAKDKQYGLEEIWFPFSADQCPSLAGKPKLFFIQACKGEQKDDGIELKHDEVDGKKKSKVVEKPAPYKIPTQADFLICYATVPGYVAWRNPQRGSWFVESFCSVMEEYAHKCHMEELLLMVRRQVALEYPSNVLPEKEKEGLNKQMPTTISTLIRFLKFDQKTVISNYEGCL